jgi:ABC-type multidrug transport system fused ATPase/permease subunit
MTALPVATPSQVRAYAVAIARRHRRAMTGAVGLHAAAALAGLAGPPLLGAIVDAVGRGTTAGHVDRLALAVLVALVVQVGLVVMARQASYVLGERVLAELREEFLDRVLALPLGTVERAGTGDLLTRSTRDGDEVAEVVRFAVPETLIAFVTTTLTVAAAVVVAPRVALPCFVVVPLLWASTRWYLNRARAGYLREGAAWSRLTAGVAETVDGGRTIEALGLQQRRIRRSDDDMRGQFAAERYTLFLRTVWFPLVESAYVVPITCAILVGGLLHARGLATLGEVTTVVLYMRSTTSRSAGPRSPGCSASPTCPPTARRAAVSRSTSGWWRGTCASPTPLGGTSCTASTSTCARGSGWRWSARAAPASRPSDGCSPASTARAPAR